MKKFFNEKKDASLISIFYSIFAGIFAIFSQNTFNIDYFSNFIIFGVIFSFISEYAYTHEL